MKKLVYSLVMICLGGMAIQAQDSDAGDKKVKLGIGVTPAINWLSPDNSNKVTSNGSTLKAGIGLIADFRLTDIIWFHTGLEYTSAGGKLAYKSKDTAFYFYKDDAIKPISPDNVTYTASQQGYKVYQLQTRNHKVGYIHIPVGFKLKTKELSGITYFGQIGGDMFFRTSAKGDDEVVDWSASNRPTLDLKGNDISGTVNFFNAAAHVGAGMEYRISGSTAIMASLQYRHGIMNFTDAGNNYLLRSTTSGGTTDFTTFPNATKLRQVVLTVAIMF